jgi:hypothetical protein
MKTNNYLVKFYRKAERYGERDTHLGSIEMDDIGIGPELSLMAKAFRQAPPRCLLANLVKIEHS